MSLLQNLAGTGFKSGVGAVIRLPLRLIPGRSVVRILGGIAKGLKWRVGASTHGCWLGTYEPEAQKILQDMVRPGDVCFDVGANAGFYTLGFANLTGPTGRVCAFEPMAENAAQLLFHLKVNALSNATLVQAAVSDREGLAGFQIHASNTMGSLGGGPDTGYQVPTLTLDSVVQTQTLPAPQVMKIDVEGAEGAVLRGATRLLREARPRMLVALHGASCFRECVELLRESGYVVTDPTGNPVHPDQTDWPSDIVAVPAQPAS